MVAEVCLMNKNRAMSAAWRQSGAFPQRSDNSAHTTHRAGLSARPNRLGGVDVRQRDAVDNVEPRAGNHGAARRKLLKAPKTADNIGVNLQD